MRYDVKGTTLMQGPLTFFIFDNKYGAKVEYTDTVDRKACQKRCDELNKDEQERNK